METQSFGMCFLIRKTKADKKRADIYARVTVDGEGKEFSVKEQIDTASWNKEKGLVKGNSMEVKSINEHLNNVRFEVKNKYRALLDAGEIITAESIRNAYLGVQTNQKSHTLRELLKYYKEIWELKLKNGGFKNYKPPLNTWNCFLSPSILQAMFIYPRSMDNLLRILSIISEPVLLKIMIPVREMALESISSGLKES